MSPYQRWMLLALYGLSLGLAGCATAEAAAGDSPLEQLAIKCVRNALTYPQNPTVRSQGLEAAADVFDPKGILPAIREALKDDHPGVRFTACMVLGKLRDREAKKRLLQLTSDPDASVRVGAYYALECIGEFHFRKAWRDALRSHDDPAVRRNAALTMGRLGNPKLKPLLRAAAALDKDEGVQLQASEGLALLGDQDAIMHFIRDSYGGLGYKQPFALLTLGEVGGDQVVPVLRRGLENSPYIEAQLAAARGLGKLGYVDGYDLALKSLNWNDPKKVDPDDSPELQIMRVHQMAALALGEIGRKQALGSLERLMKQSKDARVQLAAATAVLMIVNKNAAIQARGK